jgi:hypothetical protein
VKGDWGLDMFCGITAQGGKNAQSQEFSKAINSASGTI